ncbi:MAG TPA: VOC family protein [Candidatus Acidoferrum sp.]|nr:VOC family protein [Candidatus Acidoferrum sp.]
MPAPHRSVSHTWLNRIVAFLVTTKPGAATRFYRDKMGFKLSSEDDFALVFDANGTMLRIVKMKDGQFQPAAYTVLGWDVDDAARAVAELVKRGIAFERYPGMPRDKDGIWTSPSGAKVAWFKDPDGNVLSLTEFARS